MIGPHQSIPLADGRERFAARMLDALWERYRRRVPHVAVYERVIAEAGATFVNDHIAFRTFATQRPPGGIASVARIFEALGYRAAGCYDFDDKHLTARHYQHPNRGLPKLFVSELRTWQLSRPSRERIERTLQTQRPPVEGETLAALESLAADADDRGHDALLAAVLREFIERPWPVPAREDVIALNAESQYAAWVLVHGHEVNHFTALINSHGVPHLQNIDLVVDVLRRAGVPMKADIEGAPGSRLRQTATEAAVIDVPMMDDGRETMMPWTYAYFELAERAELPDPETGQFTRFEGFLGPQATHLFEMTRAR